MNNLIACPEMITYILQYLPGEKLLYLYDHMMLFRRAVRKSDHIMNAVIDIRKNDNLSALCENQFILCAGQNLYDLKIIRAQLRNANFRARVYGLIYNRKISDYVTEIYYDVFNNDNADPVSDDPRNINPYSENIADNNCHLYVKDRDNFEITGTTINNLHLRNCHHVTISSRVRRKIHLCHCHHITIKQLHIDTLIIDGCKHIWTNNIFLLRNDTWEYMKNIYSKFKNIHTYIGLNSNNILSNDEFDSIQNIFVDVLNEYSDDAIKFININKIYNITIQNIEGHEPHKCYTVKIANCPDLVSVKIRIPENCMDCSILECPQLKIIKVDKPIKKNDRIMFDNENAIKKYL